MVSGELYIQLAMTENKRKHLPTSKKSSYSTILAVTRYLVQLTQRQLADEIA